MPQPPKPPIPPWGAPSTASTLPPAAPPGVPQPPALSPGLQPPQDSMQKPLPRHPEERPVPGQMPLSPPLVEAPAPPPGPQSVQDLDALREQHYQEMRERVKARGGDMPEIPPWKAAGMSEQERRAQMEQMRNLSPAERQAQHEAMWQRMRERAKQRGVELPEACPMGLPGTGRLSQQEREQYQGIVDQMSPEQREAARAIFGAPPHHCLMASPWGGQGEQGTLPRGGMQGSGPLPGMPQGNWPGPGPAQAPMGQGDFPQGYPFGQGGPWGYGSGAGMPEGQGPGGFARPQGGGPGYWGSQGWWPSYPGNQGPGFGGYPQEMPPAPRSSFPGGTAQ